MSCLLNPRRESRFVDMPIFPLGTVLLPQTLLPLKLFEPRYLDMASHAFKTGEPFGVCLIREGPEVGAGAVPEPVGCAATIADWDMQQLGVLKLRVLGGERFHIEATRTGNNGLLRADGRWRPMPRRALAPEFASSAAFLQSVIERSGEALFAQPFDYADAGWVSLRLTEVLPIRLDAKQKLLELDDGNQRMQVLVRFLKAQKLLPS